MFGKIEVMGRRLRLDLLSPQEAGRIHCLEGCNIPVGGVAAEESGKAARCFGDDSASAAAAECFQHPRSPIREDWAD